MSNFSIVNANEYFIMKYIYENGPSIIKLFHLEKILSTHDIYVQVHITISCLKHSNYVKFICFINNLYVSNNLMLYILYIHSVSYD